MPKRQKLNFDPRELTQNLKQSTGKGVDAFFSPSPPLPETRAKKQRGEHIDLSAGRKQTPSPKAQEAKSSDDRKKDSSKAIKQAITLSSKLSRYHDSTIDSIRKVVKTVGREVAFVRLTEGEKRQLADAVYSYKRQKVKTSENQLIRIGVNFLLEDYKANGKESLLERVIKALNA